MPVPAAVEILFRLDTPADLGHKTQSGYNREHRENHSFHGQPSLRSSRTHFWESTSTWRSHSNTCRPSRILRPPPRELHAKKTSLPPRRPGPKNDHGPRPSSKLHHRGCKAPMAVIEATVPRQDGTRGTNTSFLRRQSESANGRKPVVCHWAKLWM